MPFPAPEETEDLRLRTREQVGNEELLRSAAPCALDLIGNTLVGGTSSPSGVDVPEISSKFIQGKQAGSLLSACMPKAGVGVDVTVNAAQVDAVTLRKDTVSFNTELVEYHEQQAAKGAPRAGEIDADKLRADQEGKKDTGQTAAHLLHNTEQYSSRTNAQIEVPAVTTPTEVVLEVNDAVNSDAELKHREKEVTRGSNSERVPAISTEAEVRPEVEEISANKEVKYKRRLMEKEASSCESMKISAPLAEGQRCKTEALPMAEHNLPDIEKCSPQAKVEAAPATASAHEGISPEQKEAILASKQAVEYQGNLVEKETQIDATAEGNVCKNREHEAYAVQPVGPALPTVESTPETKVEAEIPATNSQAEVVLESKDPVSIKEPESAESMSSPRGAIANNPSTEHVHTSTESHRSQVPVEVEIPVSTTTPEVPSATRDFVSPKTGVVEYEGQLGEREENERTVHIQSHLGTSEQSKEYATASTGEELSKTALYPADQNKGSKMSLTSAVEHKKQETEKSVRDTTEVHICEREPTKTEELQVAEGKYEAFYLANEQRRTEIATAKKDKIQAVDRHVPKPYPETEAPGTCSNEAVLSDAKLVALTSREVLGGVHTEHDPSSQPALLAGSANETIDAALIDHGLPVVDNHTVQSVVRTAEPTHKTVEESAMAEAKHADWKSEERFEHKNLSEETTAESKAPLAIDHDRETQPTLPKDSEQRERSSSVSTDHEKTIPPAESDDFLPEGIPDPVASLTGFFDEHGTSQTTLQNTQEHSVTSDGLHEKVNIIKGTGSPKEESHLRGTKREPETQSACIGKDAAVERIKSSKSPPALTEDGALSENASAISQERAQQEGYEDTGELRQTEQRITTNSLISAVEKKPSSGEKDVALPRKEGVDHKPSFSGKDESSEGSKAGSHHLQL